VVFQPHLFSRTQELGKEMGEALCWPTSPSSSTSTRPARTRSPAHQRADHRRGQGPGATVTAVHDKSTVPDVVAGMAAPGDLVLTMGRAT